MRETQYLFSFLFQQIVFLIFQNQTDFPLKVITIGTFRVALFFQENNRFSRNSIFPITSTRVRDSSLNVMNFHDNRFNNEYALLRS